MKAFEHVSFSVVWGWGTHWELPVEILAVVCSYMAFARRVLAAYRVEPTQCRHFGDIARSTAAQAGCEAKAGNNAALGTQAAGNTAARDI